MKSSITILVCISALILVCLGLFIFRRTGKVESPSKIVADTWAGYKKNFIDESGRVKRVKNGDTVSEGQAYAMLRAVWMNDKEIFDRCYHWTEESLSRKKITGDNLLAWHWKDGKITDPMPASDADIDYALSLIFAQSRWADYQRDADNYGGKAKELLADILRLETYSTKSGRIYLSPWIISDKQQDVYPVNPSYYSPAHFRIFYDYTKDKRWLALIDTTYYLLSSLQNELNGSKGVGLVPDWCAVDDLDNFIPFEGKNDGFGYEALRVPFRVGLDYYWFRTAEAERSLRKFSDFIQKQVLREGGVFCEYSYEGMVRKKYESPAFYACYYYAVNVDDVNLGQNFLKKTRKYIRSTGDGSVYFDIDEYYVNSLAWLAEGLHSGTIKNLYEIEE